MVDKTLEHITAINKMIESIPQENKKPQQIILSKEMAQSFYNYHGLSVYFNTKIVAESGDEFVHHGIKFIVA